MASFDETPPDAAANRLRALLSRTWGTVLSRKQLIKKLSDHFGAHLLVLSSPGIANIIVFRYKASDILRVVYDDDDDLDVAITNVSKTVKADVKRIHVYKGHYSTGIDTESAIQSVSTTVLDLLANLSPKLDKTLPALLIGSMITNTLSNHPTQLQISLGILIRDSKALVKQMHAFGVTCSYDEVLRFKKSAALASTHAIELAGVSNATTGLVQMIGDNFDADISSQNGKKSTHSLALLLTQPDQAETSSNSPPSIEHIQKTDMARPIEYELEIQRFKGPKKPDMPGNTTVNTVIPLRILAQKCLSQTRADRADFTFMRDVVSLPMCPEYNGYNTAASREGECSPKPETNAVYLPLIDMTPSDPDTIMTALARAQDLTHSTGQEFVVFTCDLQLYRVALNVIWTYRDRFSNVIMRLGGMHSLMSFAGSIGTLMTESGLSEVMSSVFGGVQKMMSGKKFPQNVRAMRLVAEEVLRKLMGTNTIGNMDELHTVLDEVAAQSKTSKLCPHNQCKLGITPQSAKYVIGFLEHEQ